MFAYPRHAKFGRPVSKSKLYTHGKVTPRVKDLFVKQVADIIWKYKLSPETINLPAQRGIQEIQVFELHLKTPNLDEAVLKAIDRAIPHPLLYRLIFEDRVHFAASYKRPSESDHTKWVIEGLFTTDPINVSSLSLKPLPVALDLASLYDQLVRAHIPLSPRPGESLSEQVSRYRALRSKQKEVRQLEACITQEKQFNRKVELNAALRLHTTELESLK